MQVSTKWIPAILTICPKNVAILEQWHNVPKHSFLFRNGLLSVFQTNSQCFNWRVCPFRGVQIWERERCCVYSCRKLVFAPSPPRSSVFFWPQSDKTGSRSGGIEIYVTRTPPNASFRWDASERAPQPQLSTTYFQQYVTLWTSKDLLWSDSCPKACMKTGLFVLCSTIYWFYTTIKQVQDPTRPQAAFLL